RWRMAGIDARTAEVRPEAAEALRRPLDLQRIRTVPVRPRRPAQAGNFDEGPDADAGTDRAQDYVGRTVTQSKSSRQDRGGHNIEQQQPPRRFVSVMQPLDRYSEIYPGQSQNNGYANRDRRWVRSVDLEGDPQDDEQRAYHAHR